MPAAVSCRHWRSGRRRTSGPDGTRSSVFFTDRWPSLSWSPGQQVANCNACREEVTYQSVCKATDWYNVPSTEHGSGIPVCRLTYRPLSNRGPELSTATLIQVRNHPRGEPTSPHDDIAMTEQIRMVAGAPSIQRPDHIAVGNACWLSFRSKGLVEKSGEPRTACGIPFLRLLLGAAECHRQHQWHIGAAAPHSTAHAPLSRTWAVYS